MGDQLRIFQQGNVAYARRDTLDTPRVGCSSTDTSFRSFDRHKGVDEATVVLWSRGRLRYICHMAPSYCGVFDPRLCTEMETAAFAAGAVLNAAVQPDQKQRSQTVFCFVVMLMDRRELSRLPKTAYLEGPLNGGEIMEAYEPKAGTRAAGFMSDFLSSLEK